MFLRKAIFPPRTPAENQVRRSLRSKLSNPNETPNVLTMSGIWLHARSTLSSFFWMRTVLVSLGELPFQGFPSSP